MAEDTKKKATDESVVKKVETSSDMATASSEAVDVNTMKSNKMIVGLVVALVVAVVLIYGGMSLFVYRFDTNPVAQTVARVVPIPAAMVNWMPISYENYLTEAKLTQQFYEFTAGEGAAAGPTRGEVLDVLVQKRLVEDYVNAHNIVVSDEEVEEQITALLGSIGMTREEFDDFIVSSFGVDVGVYREHAILPDMYRARVAEDLLTNDDFAAEAMGKADAAYERLQAGEAYEDVAKEVSEDTVSAAEGGSIGAFLVDSIPEDVRDEVMGLAAGEYSKPLYTPGSYAIIKMEAINEAGAKVDGQIVEETTYDLKGIFFFTPGLEDWLIKQTDGARIYAFVRNTDSAVDLLTAADRKKAEEASTQDTSGTLEGDVIDDFAEPATEDGVDAEDVTLDDATVETDATVSTDAATVTE